MNDIEFAPVPDGEKITDKTFENLGNTKGDDDES